MQAIELIKYGSAADAFKVVEKENPVANDNEVVIKVAAFGLNYADVMARNGLYKDAPPIPCVLGYEAAGTVDSIGKNVQGFSIGDRVTGFTRFGGYAEYVVVDSRGLVPIPENTTTSEATALTTQYGTAYYCAYEMVSLFKGDHVLIHAAAGGVGTALIQLAKHKGCIVYGTAGSDEKLEYLKKIGVDFPINYRKQDFEEEIKKLRGKEGIDVIFDPVGGTNYKKGRKILSHGGRIVSYGVSERSGKKWGILSDIKLMLNFGFLHPVFLLMKSQGAIGVNMLRIGDHKPDTLKRCLDGVISLVREEVLKPHIGGTFKSNEIAQAHELLESRKSIGKIVVEW